MMSYIRKSKRDLYHFSIMIDLQLDQSLRDKLEQPRMFHDRMCDRSCGDIVSSISHNLIECISKSKFIIPTINTV